MLGLQTTALQRALGKFNIAEVARTGKICLKRGEALLDMGGWGDGQKKQMRDEQQDRAEAAASEAENGNGSAGSSKGAADAAPAEERGVDEGQDVYVSGGRETAGDLFALVPVIVQIGIAFAIPGCCCC